MYILIWILFIALILILVAISEHEIAKQDAEWIKEFKKEKNQWRKK